MKHARIRLEPMGMHSELVIVNDDGTEHDITNAVSEVTVRRTVDGSCTASVGMPWVMAAVEAHGVELDERTRATLLSLGWTPPRMTKQRVSELFEQETGTSSAGLTRDEMLTELRQRGVATGDSEV